MPLAVRARVASLLAGLAAAGLLAVGASLVLDSATTAGTDAALATADEFPPGGEPAPVPAVEGVIAALDQAPVVAIGESHNLAEAGRFYARLVHSDKLAAAADAVVVEFGSARYQRLIDRYVGGDRVRRSRLRRVWQDTTQVGAWDAPIYRRFFAAVRESNGDRDRDRQIRVLLGDPPIDWSRMTSTNQVERFLLRREQFMAHVIEREVLAKERRAIVIAGLAHLERSPTPVKHPNTTQILDKRHPGSVWVIGANLGFPRAEWNDALSGWPLPAIASLRGTWIGLLPKGEGTAQDALDSMLYLGAPDSLHLSSPLPSTYRDDRYWRALRHRWPLGVGGDFSAKALAGLYGEPGYPGLFTQRGIAALQAFAGCMRDHGVERHPDPQFQYDAVGFYGPAAEEARNDPDHPQAFKACGDLVASEP